MPGLIAAVNKRETGMLVSEWGEDHIYENLTKFIFKYIKGLGSAKILLIVIIYSISIFMFIMIDVWIGFWSTTSKSGKYSLSTYMAVYIAISLFSSILQMMRDNLLVRLLLNNSSRIHN